MFDVEDISCEIIASSSKGNCVRYGNIIIDCGISYKQIEKHLKGVDIILVTHKHGDHFKISTIKKILNEHYKIKIFGNQDVVNFGIQKGIKINLIEEDKIIKFKDLKIYPFLVPHDEDVINFGYRLLMKNDLNQDVKFIHITDVGEISQISAKNYHFAGIESNYKEKKINGNMDTFKKENDVFNFNRLKRVKLSHLSEEQFQNWINVNNPKQFRRLHISENNY